MRQRLASDFAIGLLLWGIPIALIGVFPEPPAALILLGIVGVGNTIVDAVARILKGRRRPEPDPGRATILVTLHRRESFGPPLERALGAIRRLALDLDPGWVPLCNAVVRFRYA